MLHPQLWSVWRETHIWADIQPHVNDEFYSNNDFYVSSAITKNAQKNKYMTENINVSIITAQRKKQVKTPVLSHLYRTSG